MLHNEVDGHCGAESNSVREGQEGNTVCVHRRAQEPEAKTSRKVALTLQSESPEPPSLQLGS